MENRTSLEITQAGESMDWLMDMVIPRIEYVPAAF